MVHESFAAGCGADGAAAAEAAAREAGWRIAELEG